MHPVDSDWEAFQLFYLNAVQDGHGKQFLKRYRNLNKRMRDTRKSLALALAQTIEGETSHVQDRQA